MVGRGWLRVVSAGLPAQNRHGGAGAFDVGMVPVERQWMALR